MILRRSSTNLWKVIPGLGLAIVLLFNGSLAGAQVTDMGACVSSNRKFGGATAACAEAICSWQVCKDQIMYRESNTSRLSGTPNYTRDQGAAGTALAVCAPHEQVMQQCLSANTRKKVKSKPKKKEAGDKTPEKPAKEQWCKTGSDSDLETIGSKVDAMKQELLAYKKKLKPLRDEYRALGAAKKEQLAFITEEKAAHQADIAAFKSGSIDLETYRSRWTYSGRLDRLNDTVDAYSSKLARRKELWRLIEPLQTDYRKLGEHYKYIALQLLDTDHDCAGALSALD